MFLLEDLLKTGVYNRDQKNFSLRTQDTADPYPDLNREALHRVSEILENHYTHQTQKIQGQDMDLLLREANPSRMFGNLYGYYLHHYTNSLVSFNPQVTRGQWVKYPRGDEQAAKTLFESVQGKGTGWCLAGSCKVSQDYIKHEDFYLYYSLDREGRPTIPRIAIAIDNEVGEIHEIRGRGSDQALDSFISESGVLDKKLLEFGDKGARYFKKVSDMRNLTDIYKRHSKGEELSPEDLRFLYEIDGTIEGFGDSKPKRIQEIITQRDIKWDIALALGVQPEQVSLTHEEALSGGIVYHYGDLVVYDLTIPESLEKLSYIRGNAYFENVTSGKNLENLSRIGGNANFSSLESPKGLEKLSYIGGNAHLNLLKRAQELEKLFYIGGNALFNSLKSPEGLEKLSYIGGTARFDSLKTAQALKKLSHIGGNALFISLESPEELKNLSYIGGEAWFGSLKKQNPTK